VKGLEGDKDSGKKGGQLGIRTELFRNAGEADVRVFPGEGGGGNYS